MEDIKGINPPPFFVNITEEQHREFLGILKNGENNF